MRPRRMGKLAAGAQRAGNGVGMAHRAPARVPVVVAAVVAGSLLRVFRGVWVGANIYSALVAALLVQHALRAGAAAGVCAGRWVLYSVPIDRGARVQAAMAAVCAAALFGVVGLNAAVMVRERPLVYVEGTKNIEARRAYDIDDSAGAARARGSASRSAGADEHLGASRICGVQRNSAAPDHQRERQASSTRRRWPLRRSTPQWCWRSKATRLTARCRRIPRA